MMLPCVLLLSTALAYGGQSSSQKAEIDWHALGSTPCAWSPPVADAKGAIDPEATIQILKANGLGCYGALIWLQRQGGPPTFDWANFKTFVAAAQPAGIIVWAILIPPSEGGNSPPFNRDSVRWMQELARLSLKYPCLKGVNIDDFYWDTRFFTPQYTCRLYSAKQNINPRLQFAPTIYALDTDFAQRCGGCIDGVWLWWRNPEDNVGLDVWLKNSRLLEKNVFPFTEAFMPGPRIGTRRGGRNPVSCAVRSRRHADMPMVRSSGRWLSLPPIRCWTLRGLSVLKVLRLWRDNAGLLSIRPAIQR